MKLLEDSGVEIPEADQLDDATLTTKLKEITDRMASICQEGQAFRAPLRGVVYGEARQYFALTNSEHGAYPSVLGIKLKDFVKEFEKVNESIEQ